MGYQAWPIHQQQLAAETTNERDINECGMVGFDRSRSGPPQRDRSPAIDRRADRRLVGLVDEW
jgi:hypothetical protein